MSEGTSFAAVATSDRSERRARPTAVDALAALALVAVAAIYYWRLGTWLINDDEGSYLYAAWRISLGELPYRDFLTPQLPAFLLPGGLAMRVFGDSVIVGRSIAVFLTLAAGVACWATARRLFGPLAALVAGLALLLHPDVYLHCRTFRPEPFMLFFVCLAVYLFARGVVASADASPDRRWLAASGVIFGLAALSKLFGILPLAGCLAWLVSDGLLHRRPLRSTAADLAALAVPAGATAAVGLGAFAALGAPVLDDVLGHHLRQGAGLGAGEVARKALALYAEFLRYNNNAMLAFVAGAVAVIAARFVLRRELVFAWQIPTALVFLFLSRELWTRHLLYLLPALATLYGVAAGWLFRDWPGALGEGGRRAGFALKAVGVALVAALVLPALLVDRDTGWRWEDGTRRLADVVALATQPGAIVLADYSELNFYARRPTTYSAASLSAGAAGSGQITWQTIRDELEAGHDRPALLLVDRTPTGGPEYGQLRFLHDLAEFETWVAEHYEQAGVFRRDPQLFRVYVPKGEPLPTVAQVENGPALVAAQPSKATAAAGETLDVLTAWIAPGPTEKPLMATVRLVDDAGRQWAQADQALTATRQRPTDEWTEGEITADRLPLAVPPGTPPGEYEIRLGVYPYGSVEPLPWSGASGQALGRSVNVGSVEVSAWRTSAKAGRRAAAAYYEEKPPRAGAAVAELGGTGKAAAQVFGPGPQWDGLSLLAVGRMPTTTLAAGSVWPLDLWWRAESAPADLAARVTLEDGAGQASGGETTQPLGRPGASSATWPPGAVVRQQIAAPVAATAGDGVYALMVRLVDDSSQPASGAGAVQIGEVSVAARDLASVVTSPPKVGRRIDAAFGDVALLFGAGAGDSFGDAAQAAKSGRPLAVTLFWQAIAPSAVPYQVTVQLLDEAGTVVAQHDGVPAAGARPTVSWLPGEYVTDEHVLELPTTLPPGTYDLVVALYDADTMRRVDATGGDADAAAHTARVARIRVEP